MAVRGPPSGAPGKDDLDPPLHVIDCNLVCIPVTPCRSTPLIATPDALPQEHSLPYGSGQLPDVDLTSGTRLRRLHPTRCLAGHRLRPRRRGAVEALRSASWWGPRLPTPAGDPGTRALSRATSWAAHPVGRSSSAWRLPFVGWRLVDTGASTTSSLPMPAPLQGGRYPP